MRASQTPSRERNDIRAGLLEEGVGSAVIAIGVNLEQYTCINWP